MADDSAPKLVHVYYDSWKKGAGSYDEARLLGILASDLKFEGSIAGKQVGAQAFLPGLARFAHSVKALRVLQTVHAGNEASVLYECDLIKPAGTFRFAEFFRVKKGKIQEINLVFDTTAFRKLM